MSTATKRSNNNNNNNEDDEDNQHQHQHQHQQHHRHHHHHHHHNQHPAIGIAAVNHSSTTTVATKTERETATATTRVVPSSFSSFSSFRSSSSSASFPSSSSPFFPMSTSSSSTISNPVTNTKGSPTSTTPKTTKSTTTNIVQLLPTCQWMTIFDYLLPSETQYGLSCSCTQLWNQRYEIETKRKVLQVQSQLDYNAIVTIITSSYNHHHHHHHHNHDIIIQRRMRMNSACGSAGGSDPSSSPLQLLPALHLSLSSPAHFYQNHHLMELTLGSYATDEFFLRLFGITPTTIATATATATTAQHDPNQNRNPNPNPNSQSCVVGLDPVPSLERISCIGSIKLTDIGLLSIIPPPLPLLPVPQNNQWVSNDHQHQHHQHQRRQEKLQLIDITYCKNTTYQATLELRKRRRQHQQQQQLLSSLSPPPATSATEATTSSSSPPSSSLSSSSSFVLVIRRQPQWMDGQFETSFANDGLHTYWPDGSFSYDRQEQSKGYILQVEPWNTPIIRTNNTTSTTTNNQNQNQNHNNQKKKKRKTSHHHQHHDDDDTATSKSSDNNESSYSPYHHIRTKLQFSDFEVPHGDGWPPWSKYLYRPGVSLLYLPPSSEASSSSSSLSLSSPKNNNKNDMMDTNHDDHQNQNHNQDRTILVSQMVRGIYPPRDWPRPCHASLPIGITTYYDSSGRLIEQRNRNRNRNRNQNHNNNNDYDTDDTDEDEEDYQIEYDIADRCYMVTRMRIRPLPTLMPPDDVIQSIERFLHLSTIDPTVHGNILVDNHENRALEHFLHLQLGGDPESIL